MTRILASYLPWPGENSNAVKRDTERVAVVTLAIGTKYSMAFDLYTKRSLEAYCERHHFDLHVVRKPLDLSLRAASRSPAWQKLLILSQSWSGRYDRIIWMDSDIYVNPMAPSIIDGVPPERVGAVKKGSGGEIAAFHSTLKPSFSNVFFRLQPNPLPHIHTRKHTKRTY
jgi:hypothetical protein